MPKTKLELTWPGKEERPQLEPRILLEHPERGHHAAACREGDLFENMLIKGDNLLALKALEQDYAGKVKCVFIDPPYNTGSAFEQYEDGLEHSLWLSLMRDRVVMLRDLLAHDGTLWITLDDNEAHYFKVMCDEVFGRRNFIADVVWRSSDNSNNDAKQFSIDHNHLLVYAKSESWVSKRLRGDDEKYKHFKNPDGDPRGPWFDGNPLGSPNRRENLIYNLTSPQGHTVKPPANGWRWSRETMAEKMQTGEIRFTEDGRGIRRRTYLREQGGLPPSSLWTDLDESGHNRQAKSEQKGLFPDWTKTELFATPKPEKLLKKVLDLTTEEGDLILDSFAGSGTTGAVAHKMGRRWIMVEVGNHADTHVIPRLTKVIDGEDQGGVTKAVGWQGGGGFRYYTLAPSLLERDAYDNWVIAPEYNGPMLAEAMCKHLGFTYDPAQKTDGHEAEWWRHGRSSERDFLYVTTQALTHEALRLLSDEVGPDRSLLVCARAFSGDVDGFENLTCRKIPATILTKCEWGRDDYSLAVATLPARGDEEKGRNSSHEGAKARREEG